VHSATAAAVGDHAAAPAAAGPADAATAAGGAWPALPGAPGQASTNSDSDGGNSGGASAGPIPGPVADGGDCELGGEVTAQDLLSLTTWTPPPAPTPASPPVREG
jgi:hypothetical protein